MIKCFCSGLNGNCYMCGGMGFYEEVKLDLAGKMFSKNNESSAKDSSKEIKKEDPLVNTKGHKKENNTPSYIINNAKYYNKQTFINLLQFLTEKRNSLKSNKNTELDLIQIQVLGNKLNSVREILRLNSYGIDREIIVKKKENWIETNTSNKKGNKTNSKSNKTNFSKKRQNISLNKNQKNEIKPIKIIRSKFGDLFKLGLVKPLKK